MSRPPLHTSVLAEIRRLLEPLRTAAADVRPVGEAGEPLAFGLHEALAEMGLADRLPGDSMETLPSAAAAIEAAAVAITAPGGDDTLLAAADLLLEVEAVVDALRALATPPPGAELPPDPADAEEIGRAVWAWLAWRRLRTASPAVEAIAEMMGVVVPPEDDRPMALRSGRVGDLLRAPAATLAEAVGWGGVFDADLALGTMERVAEALGLPAQLDLRATGLPDASEELVLRLALSWMAGETGLLVSADDPAAPRGLAIEAYGTGALRFGRVLLYRAALRVEAETAAEAAPRLLLRPEGLVAEGGAAAADGRGVATLEVEDPDGAPLTLLTMGPLGAVTAGRMRVSVTLDWAAGAAQLEAAVDEGRAIIDGGERDGFLARVLPAEGIEATFDLVLGFSAAEGLTVHGGAGLKIDLPMALKPFGAVSLDRLRLAAQPFDGPRLDMRAALSAQLGPLAVAVDGIGLRAALSPKEEAVLRLGPVGADLTPLSPTGVGLTLDLGVLRGGGFLSVEPSRYAGALELTAGELSLAAFGLIETRLPDGSGGFSMLLFVSGQFAPVQLGFGFTLLGVGGLLGVHRDVDPNALFAAVRAGTAGDLLAPEDPVRDATRLIALAEGIFPSQRGQYVFGPTVKLGWGTPTMMSLDLALAATLPEPLRLVMIGRLRGTIPSPAAPILRINLDLAGLLDLSGRRLELEGVLFDSAIQTIPVEGGFALRSSWGAERALIFSIGGLHPGFEAPPRFPDLPLMGTTLTKGSRLRLTLGGYFAITSNTFQIGAAVDLRVSAAGFTLLGGLGFDALVEFDPFRMVVDVRARVQVMKGRRSITKLTFRGKLSGPNPWHARGKVVVEIPILPDVTVGASATFGRETAVPSTPVDVLSLVTEAIASSEAWSPAGPPAGLVLAPRAEGRIDPRGALRLRQEAAPLGLPWEQFHGKPIEGATRAAVEGISVAGTPLALGALTEAAFPPAAFRRLTEAQRLAAPAFEDLTAGAEVDPSALAASGDVAAKVDARETVVHGPEAQETPTRHAGLAGVALEPPPALPSVVRVRPERWRAADAEGRPVGPPTSWSAASHGPHASVLAAEAAA